jgi:hypothetical protein
MNAKDEEPATPRAVLCELVARSRLGMVEDLEEGEAPPLYVNECFAQALIAQMKEDQDGKYQSPLEIVVPPYFSVGGVIVFVTNDMFPKAKNVRNFYAAVFKMPV